VISRFKSFVAPPAEHISGTLWHQWQLWRQLKRGRFPSPGRLNGKHPPTHGVREGGCLRGWWPAGG